MTRAQASAMSQALASHTIPHDVILRYDAAANEVWSVALDPTRVYTGAELAQLTTYCQNNGLTLTVVVQQMGAV